MNTTATRAEKEHPAKEEESWELRRPERSIVDLALACAVALFAMQCVRRFFLYSQFDSDEGIAFQGAMRILRGEIPYRDFFLFYTPGSYYLYAGLFRVFGPSLAVARILLMSYAAMFSFLTYMLARRFSSRAAALFSAALLALICLPSRFENLHSWDSTAAALLALYCAVWFLQTRAIAWAFLAGLLTGIAAMTEQTRGTGMVMGLVLAAGALHWSDPVQWPLRRFVPAALGSTLPVLAVTSYFAAHHSFRAMLDGWFWPLHHYTGANRLPYGYMFWSQVHIFGVMGKLEQSLFALALSAMITVSLLPLLTVFLGVGCVIKILIRRLEPTPLSLLIVLVGCVSLGNFLAALATSRPDYVRMVYSAPLLFFTIPLLLDPRLVRLPSLLKSQPLIAVYMLVSFILCSLLFGITASEASDVIVTRRGTFRTNKGEVLSYLQTHVAAGDKVLIYPYSAMYSFLSGTFSPTRFDFLQLGMHTPEQFEAARQELERDRTPVVLFDITFPGLITQVWPSTNSAALAHDPMSEFIFSHYRSCKILRPGNRPFAYMVRKDLACPPD